MADEFPRKRLPPEQRIDQIVSASAEIFAAKGFATSTRAMAAELGITQGLLYRYFPSKDALIEEVFRRYFLDRWKAQWGEILADRTQPLEQRLNALYGAFLDRSSPTTLRLFMRANLDGLDLARRYGIPLTEWLLTPIVEELRHEAGLPLLAGKAPSAGERELALILHGGIMFTRIREHIYQGSMGGTLTELIALHVRTWLPGAVASIGRLHEEGSQDSTRE